MPAHTAAPPPLQRSLDGTLFPPQALNHRVIAVMVDNSPSDARPQSGLAGADIVYEAEAEGGITRYMALYLKAAPKEIGPVRSTRLYFVDLARPYSPLFAHAGENDDVWGPLKDLSLQGFADMEQILHVPEAFWRDDGRTMPHNLYTSAARLRSAAPRHGWPDRPLSAGEFSFANARPPKTAADVVVSFWNGYSVRYRFAHGAYVRIIDGEVQHDRGRPQPYRVANIVAVWIPARVTDADGDLEMNVYGKFPALVIAGGRITRANWVMPGPDVLPAVETQAGKTIQLQPGQIYVEILPQGGQVASGKNVWSYASSSQ